MIVHYIKIAFRNLLRYKTQSIISIVGLAVGFTCFALSSLWIRYELTYDSFHPDSERMYYVRSETKSNALGVSNITPYPLAAYLKETFPEIEIASNFNGGGEAEYKYENTLHKLYSICIDTTFYDMFGLEIISGSKDFMIDKSGKFAITESKAVELFGSEDPIGKVLKLGDKEYIICAVVRDWFGHSNMPFGILEPNNPTSVWHSYSWNTFIKLRKGVDISAFTQKLYEHKVEQEGYEGSTFTLNHLILTPIAKMRYDIPFSPYDFQVAFNHVVLFLFVGALIVFCALFNYMTIFVSRIQMRLKEVALRKICGSSLTEIFYLFSVEFILNMLMALVLGMVIVEVILSDFKELAGIHASRGDIYIEVIVYIIAISFIALLIAQVPLYYFRRRTLRISVNAKGSTKNLFRRVSIAFQLVISIGLIFCALVMMKQLYFLSDADIGMERKGIASFYAYPAIDVEISGNIIAELPMVTDVLKGYPSLIPQMMYIAMNFDYWDEKPEGAENVVANLLTAGKEFCDFHGFTLIKGRMLEEGDDYSNILINQKAAQEFGWLDPIGKKVGKDNPQTVVGVIKDFYNQSPITPVTPTVIAVKSGFERYIISGVNDRILFKYHEGTWEDCKLQIEEQMRREYPDAKLYITNSEEEYAKYLKSENALLKLLGFASIVCVIIAVFGIYSLVTLTCEQRRKEIAIRKVNGATVRDILSIFFKEHMISLLISSIISFSVGYFIMKSWLENYVQQTEISLWIYLGIFTGILLVIIASVGSRVWNAARQNPAEIIKSE